VRVPDAQRREVEQRIRAAGAALLAGNIPPGGHCDITTLARQSGVSRATLYRSYPGLKQQFEQQIAQAAVGGQHPDPRDAQIAALKARNVRLQQRLDAAQSANADLLEFQQLALSRLAAQHHEIERLRAARTPASISDLDSARANRITRPADHNPRPPPPAPR
jgi:AcrR family transcriptional regulator